MFVKGNTTRNLGCPLLPASPFVTAHFGYNITESYRAIVLRTIRLTRGSTHLVGEMEDLGPAEH